MRRRARARRLGRQPAHSGFGIGTAHIEAGPGAVRRRADPERASELVGSGLHVGEAAAARAVLGEPSPIVLDGDGQAGRPRR